MQNEFIKGSKATAILGISRKTLHRWHDKGLIDVIRTPTNQRLYNINKFMLDNSKHSDRLNICYARVSSLGQKDDLSRQKKLLQSLYPKYLIIYDIGSGLNYKRKGFKKIIELAIRGKINKLIVTYKDRLVRFGFEFIEDLVRTYSNGKIIVINKEVQIDPQKEIVQDVLQILNIYVAKINGQRSHKKYINV